MKYNQRLIWFILDNSIKNGKIKGYLEKMYLRDQLEYKSTEELEEMAQEFNRGQQHTRA